MVLLFCFAYYLSMINCIYPHPNTRMKIRNVKRQKLYVYTEEPCPSTMLLRNKASSVVTTCLKKLRHRKMTITEQEKTILTILHCGWSSFVSEVKFRKSPRQQWRMHRSQHRGWARANIPIVVPAIPTINAFQWVHLRDSRVHCSTLLRTTFKKESRSWRKQRAFTK